MSVLFKVKLKPCFLPCIVTQSCQIASELREVVNSQILEIWYSFLVHRTVSVVLLFKKQNKLMSQYCCLMFVFILTGPMLLAVNISFTATVSLSRKKMVSSASTHIKILQP